MTPVADEKALKPCPFCNQPLTVRKSGANPRAKCNTEGCFGAKLPVVNLDVPEDVAAWNTRRASAVAEAAGEKGDAPASIDVAAVARLHKEINDPSTPGNKREKAEIAATFSRACHSAPASPAEGSAECTHPAESVYWDNRDKLDQHWRCEECSARVRLGDCAAPPNEPEAGSSLFNPWDEFDGNGREVKP
jgi:hypothetical protein